MFICLITDTPHDVLGLEQMFLSLRPQALSGGLFPQKEKSHQVIIPETNRRATILIDNAMITLRFWSKIRKNTFHNCFVMTAILFNRLRETTQVCTNAGLKKIRFVQVVESTIEIDRLCLSSLGLFEAEQVQCYSIVCP